MDENGSVDVFGIKPGMEATKIIAQGGVDGIGAFLSRICLPAAEEFGLLIQDKVRNWRARNAHSMLRKAETLVAKLPGHQSRSASPRLVGAIIENSSWSDDELVQSMWAGLLASSCSENGQDETNLIFINQMHHLTKDEVVLLKYFCENAEVYKSETGLISTKGQTFVPLSKFVELLGYDDPHKFDLLVDHLRKEELIDMFSSLPSQGPSTDAVVGVTALALNLYVRAQGFIGPATSYFGLD